MRGTTRIVRLLAIGAAIGACAVSFGGSEATAQEDLDARVRKFLDANQSQWRDLNVPAIDGQTLHDIVLKNKYTRALEIGTSTGHSGIWIAWALSKTGGKLITIDIDERRHRQAVANFEAAGLSRFIDARLGNAHEIVPALAGPFDFVFSDADKDWYKSYLVASCRSSRSAAATPPTTCRPGGASPVAEPTTWSTCAASRTWRPPWTPEARAWQSATNGRSNLISA